MPSDEQLLNRITRVCQNDSLLKRYYDEIKNVYTVSTAYAYLTNINRFLDYYKSYTSQEHVDLRQIKTEDISIFLNKMYNEYTSDYIYQLQASINNFFCFYRTKGETCCEVEKIKVKQKNNPFITMENYKRIPNLLKAIETGEGLNEKQKCYHYRTRKGK